MKRIDLTGRKFGRLTVIKYYESRTTGVTRKKTRAYWLCKCNCGNEIVRNTDTLMSGGCNSCGCYRRDFMLDIREDGTLKGISKIKWKELVKKCTDKKDRRYYLYGGRGITLCDEWLDFENFFLWVKENTKSPLYNIERIDIRGIYSPDNCKIVPKPKYVRQKKERKTNHKHCPVTEREWDELARGAATMVLTEEETYDYFDKNDPYPYVFPKYACKICGWSEPTFRKYARKYLMPEIYGELPSDFFDDEHIGENKAVNARKLPRLKI